MEHVAHPRLYGAPAYARPPLSVTPTALPIDPDDLPIAVEQTPEERAVAEQLLADALSASPSAPGPPNQNPSLAFDPSRCCWAPSPIAFSAAPPRPVPKRAVGQAGFFGFFGFGGRFGVLSPTGLPSDAASCSRARASRPQAPSSVLRFPCHGSAKSVVRLRASYGWVSRSARRSPCA